MSAAPQPHDRLRGPLSEALAGHARSRSECERRRGEPPAPGDVFLFAATAELGVLWALVDRDAAARRLLAVAADPDLLVGSADVAAPEEAAGGALSLRCRFAVWLTAADFAGARRVGSVAADVVEQVRHKRAEMARGGALGSVREQETDRDPEYRDWEEVLGQAQAALLSKLRQHEPAAAAIGPRVRWRGFRGPLALAASILLVVSLGLGAGFMRQRWRLAELEQRDGRPAAHLNVPFVVLRPADARGAADAVTVPADASLVHLILAVGDPPRPEYRLRIRDEHAGTVLWQGEGLKVSGETGLLSVLLPRELLPPGEYRLTLSGVVNGETVPLAEYALAVR